MPAIFPSRRATPYSPSLNEEDEQALYDDDYNDLLFNDDDEYHDIRLDLKAKTSAHSTQQTEQETDDYYLRRETVLQKDRPVHH
ncbi:hypothetical protein BGZ54_000623 [Gamsiella multidivaricata]|nr:hypothetical protein BGZ54_000623 [Gamsiella multidivaricata]